MIYTKTGDEGQTSLVGGTRVLKCDVRVEAYGTVDELNSHLGLLAAEVADDELRAGLAHIQRVLFDVQTLLAAEQETPFPLPQVSAAEVADLEARIDAIQAELPPLHSFVLPGGSVPAAQCHVARTVCRRAERRMVALAQQQPVQPDLLRFVNRLSDYLFVLSRLLLLRAGLPEVTVAL